MPLILLIGQVFEAADIGFIMIGAALIGYSEDTKPKAPGTPASTKPGH